MISPARPFQTALFSRIMNGSATTAVFAPAAPRVYDDVPTTPKFPYVNIGDDQVVDDSHCEAAFEISSTIHVFAREGGQTQAKAIGDAIIADIGIGDLDVAGFVVKASEIEPALQSSQYFKDPDGLTAHGVLVFRFLLDQS